MKFTRYYSNLIKARGIPNLDVGQFQLINNIIALEIRINEQELIYKNLVGEPKVWVGKRNYSCYNKLNNLTKGKEPHEVFERIMSSENEL